MALAISFASGFGLYKPIQTLMAHNHSLKVDHLKLCSESGPVRWAKVDVRIICLRVITVSDSTAILATFNPRQASWGPVCPNRHPI